MRLHRMHRMLAASTPHASDERSAHPACTQWARCTHREQSKSASVACIGRVRAAGALHAVSARSGLFRCIGYKQRANRMPLMRVAAAPDTCSNRRVCTKLVPRMHRMSAASASQARTVIVFSYLNHHNPITATRLPQSNDRLPHTAPQAPPFNYRN